MILSDDVLKNDTMLSRNSCWRSKNSYDNIYIESHGLKAIKVAYAHFNSLNTYLKLTMRLRAYFLHVHSYLGLAWGNYVNMCVHDHTIIALKSFIFSNKLIFYNQVLQI